MFVQWRQTALAKIPAIITYVTNLLATAEKFIIFAHHSEILDAVEELMNDKNAGYMRIDGSTNSTHRQRNATRFQTDKQCRVAVLSIAAAGVG